MDMGTVAVGYRTYRECERPGAQRFPAVYLDPISAYRGSRDVAPEHARRVNATVPDALLTAT